MVSPARCSQQSAVRRAPPVQVYANRSDMPGGSTLAPSPQRKSPSGVDIGLGTQLAMPRAVESAGAEFIDALVKAMTCYYGKTRHGGNRSRFEYA